MDFNLSDTISKHAADQFKTSFSSATSLDIPYQRSLLLAQELDAERQSSLESRLQRASSEIEKWQERYKKLKQDFEYNLNLIEGRDRELGEYEKQMESLRLENKLLEQKLCRYSLDESCKSLLQTTKLNQEALEKQNELQRQLQTLKEQLQQGHDKRIKIEKHLKEKHEIEIKTCEENHECTIRNLKQEHMSSFRSLELKLETFEAKRRKLEEDVNEWKRKYQEKESEKRTLEIDSDEQKHQLSRQLEKVEKEKDGIIDTYQTQVEELLLKIQSVQENQFHLKAENDCLRKELTAANKKLFETEKCLKDQTNTFEQQLQQTSHQLKEHFLNEGYELQSRFEAELTEKEKEQIENFEREKQELIQRIQQLEQNSNLQKRTESEKLTSSQRDVKKLISEIQGQQQQIKTLENHLQKYQLENESLRNTCTLQLEAFGSEKQDLQKEKETVLEELRIAQSNKQEFNNEFFRTLLQERDQALGDLRAIQLKHDMETPKINAKELENEFLSLRKQFSECEKKGLLLNYELEETKEKAVKLEREKTDLKQLISQLTRDMEALAEDTVVKAPSQDYQMLHDEKLALEAKVDGLVRYCEVMQRQLKESITGRADLQTDSEVQSLREQLHKAHEIIRKTEKQLSKKGLEVSELHSKFHLNERLVNEINNLKQKEADYRSVVRQLKDELHSQKEENKHLLRISNRKTFDRRKKDDQSRGENVAKKDVVDPKDVAGIWRLNERLQSKLNKLESKGAAGRNTKREHLETRGKAVQFNNAKRKQKQRESSRHIGRSARRIESARYLRRKRVKFEGSESDAIE